MNLNNYDPPALVPFWTDESKVTALVEYLRRTSLYSLYSTFRRADAIGIFGSRSIGADRPNSDYDVCLATSTPHVQRQEHKDVIGGMDIISHPWEWSSTEHCIAGHVSRYCQWMPSGSDLGFTTFVKPGMTPKVTFIPPTELPIPFMPAGVEAGGDEWYVRTYREVLRGILELRGHPTPPSRILDLMWEEDATREQAREVVSDTHGHEIYKAMFKTRVVWCAVCASIAIEQGGCRDVEGPLHTRKTAGEWAGMHLSCPNSILYFCSDECENNWKSGQVLSGSRKWILLPHRHTAYIRG